MPDLDPRPSVRRSSRPASRRPSRGARVALACAVAALCVAALMALTGEGAQARDEVARFTVRDVAVAPSGQATTATIAAGGEGARMMPGGDFEPAIYRNRLTAIADAPNAVEATWYDASQFSTLRDGALDGAEISIMRIENGVLREVRADHVARHHVSGWIPKLPIKRMLTGDRREMTLPRASWSRPDVTRWFTVRAVDRRGRVSPTATPVSLRLGANGKGRGDERDTLIPTEAETDAPADPRGPAAPRDLRARGDGAGGAILSWTAADGDPAGWMVYASAVAPEAMVGFRFDLAGDGPPVRAGDLAILRARTLDPARTRMIADRVWNARVGMMLRPGPLGFWSDEDPRATWALRPHAPDDGSSPARDPAEDWGGESYLEMTLARGATRAIGAYNHSGTDQDFYEVLRPGVPYEVSVRLRADRPGKARFRLTGPLAGDVAPIDIPVGTEWALHTARFTVPVLRPESRPVGRMELVFDGPGRFDIDDFRIHRADTAFLDYSAEDYARLAASGVSALRTHGFIKTGATSYDLAALTRTGGLPLPGGQLPGLPETLTMMQKAGVEPWLQIEPHLSDAEWRGLVEYLAAPFRPGVDDPAKLPWAARRVAQGRAAPWTDAFEKIHFEIGNETWNQLFQPWTFMPMNDAVTGGFHGPAEVYGLFQTHVIDTMRATPWWGAAGLDDKFDIVIGGRTRFDYGDKAAEIAPSTDTLAIALYNGGWDEGEGPPARTKPSYFNVLNQVSQVTVPYARRYVEVARQLGEARGRPMQAGSYEGGPGYAMNGLNRAKVTPEQALAQEEVMKSLSAGVATLDSFLAQRQAGFALQNFFTFGEGLLWRSHAFWYKGGHAYPQWDLMSALNAVGTGEMLDVTMRSGPTADLTEGKRRLEVDDAPLIGVYAARKGDRLSVFVLSRRVPGYPDAGDDGCTPVEIALPIVSAERLTLRRATGPYDANDVEENQVEVETIPLPLPATPGALRVDAATGASACGLPPASAFIYTYEGVRG